MRLLDYIYRTREIAYELIPSLGVFGATGTVRKRLTGEAVHHKVRAKTGTLTGVTALSGYVMSRDCVVVAFTVLVNGLSVSTRRQPTRRLTRSYKCPRACPSTGGPRRGRAPKRSQKPKSRTVSAALRWTVDRFDTRPSRPVVAPPEGSRSSGQDRFSAAAPLVSR